MTGSKNKISLKISEIFHSVQGEATRAGLPTVFIRLVGCPLRCVWCDTEHAFSGGSRMTLPEIMEQVSSYTTHQICVTGGEPLAQNNCLVLLKALCDAGHDVSLETSGALDIAEVDSRVSRIVDLKAPGSGEFSKNRWQNLDLLTARDELKFVLKDRTDYEWARVTVIERQLDKRCPVLFSPVQESLDPRDLAEWILADRLNVRFQVQLHKLLWSNMRGR
ncbi:MAG: 7-carboxy-7-deazaguanine synthase QueE [Betaproteobacteria bacterium]